eukprot:scaffold6945_cov80-Skeletonema_dohrnii-CCMP3373.AAC.2
MRPRTIVPLAATMPPQHQSSVKQTRLTRTSEQDPMQLSPHAQYMTCHMDSPGKPRGAVKDIHAILPLRSGRFGSNNLDQMIDAQRPIKR